MPMVSDDLIKEIERYLLDVRDLQNPERRKDLVHTLGKYYQDRYKPGTPLDDISNLLQTANHLGFSPDGKNPLKAILLFTEEDARQSSKLYKRLSELLKQLADELPKDVSSMEENSECADLADEPCSDDTSAIKKKARSYAWLWFLLAGGSGLLILIVSNTFLDLGGRPPEDEEPPRKKGNILPPSSPLPRQSVHQVSRQSVQQVKVDKYEFWFQSARYSTSQKSLRILMHARNIQHGQSRKLVLDWQKDYMKVTIGKKHYQPNSVLFGKYSPRKKRINEIEMEAFTQVPAVITINHVPDVELVDRLSFVIGRQKKNLVKLEALPIRHDR